VALWAYFAAGDSIRMLSLTASQLAETPRVRDLQQAYLWYAMEARQYAILRRWIDPEDPNFNEQRTLLLAVLAIFIQTHPRDDLTGLIESLFPGGKGPVSALWDSARVFAACGRYAQAITLGKLALGPAVCRSRKGLASASCAETCQRGVRSRAGNFVFAYRTIRGGKATDSRNQSNQICCSDPD